MIYMRWRDGESRRGRVYRGLNPTTDSLAWLCCLVCDEPLLEHPFALVAVGPHPRYEAAMERHVAGLWYAATAIPGHAHCVANTPDEELDRICREDLSWGPVTAV